MISGEGPRPNFEVPAGSFCFLRWRCRCDPFVAHRPERSCLCFSPRGFARSDLGVRQQFGLCRPIWNAFVRGFL